jgi:hypothetical protein
MRSNKHDKCHTPKFDGESYRDIAKTIPSPRDVWKDVDLLEGVEEPEKMDVPATLPKSAKHRKKKEECEGGDEN